MLNLNQLWFFLFSCVVCSTFASFYDFNDRESNNNDGHHQDSSARSLIVGGRPTNETRYPYTVSLQLTLFARLHHCAGTLIAPDIVLSAAHCNSNTDNFVVITNPVNIRNPVADLSEVMNPLETILHPRYKRNFNDFDVMLVRLRKRSRHPPVRLNRDPDVPIAGSTVRFVGWGVMNVTTQQQSNLLLEADLTFLNNTKCQAAGRKGRLGSLDGLIRDNMMCAIGTIGVSPCSTDSGGPLTVAGDSYEQDVQVGIASWSKNRNCEGRPYPPVFARVSSVYDWIRVNVCNLSADPPSFFLCDSLGTLSPAPTPIDTESAFPTSVKVDLLIFFALDSSPRDLSWQLIRRDGRVIREVPSATYLKNTGEVQEIVTVDEGETYALVLTDTRRNGFENQRGVTVFLGTSRDYDRVLVHVEGDYGETITTKFVALSTSTMSMPAPTAPPSPFKNPVNVTVSIRFDSFPSEVGYSIQLNGRDVRRVNGYLFSDGPIVTGTFELEQETKYTFLAFDGGGDGLSEGNGGAITIYLGSEVSDDRVLLFLDGQQYGFFVTQMFTTSEAGIQSNFASPSAVPSVSPTDAPSFLPSTSLAPSMQQVMVTVAIRTDESPQQTGWRIQESDSGRIVYEMPPFSYKNAFATELTTLSLNENTTHDLILTDTMGNGMCCNNNAGAVIFLGTNALAENALASIGGKDFEFETSISFVASELGTISSFTDFPTMSPTVIASSAPSEGPSLSLEPTTTSFPTGQSIVITVVIATDSFPRETGWKITRRRSGQVIDRVSRGTYFTADTLESATVQLDSGVEYIFEINDAKGDGLCCEFGRGYAVVYLGDPSDNNVLVFDNGSFEYKRQQTFFPSMESVLKNIEIPTLAPALLPSLEPTQTMAPSSARKTNVTIVIQLDKLPFETSWRFETPNGRVIREGLPMQYTEPEGEIVETIEVDEDAEYVFRIMDSFGDGICCRYGPGSAAVYLGSSPRSDSLLIEQDGKFESEAVHYIVVSSNETFQVPTMAPSHSQVDVTVYIQLDDFLPGETGWSITNQEGRIFNSARPGRYTQRQGIVIQTVSVDLGMPHNFTILDSASDGICCQYGRGFAYVFLGSNISSLTANNDDENIKFLLNQGPVLVYDDGKFGANRTHEFIASDEGIIAVTSSPTITHYPTLSPAPSTLSVQSLSPPILLPNDTLSSSSLSSSASHDGRPLWLTIAVVFFLPFL